MSGSMDKAIAQALADGINEYFERCEIEGKATVKKSDYGFGDSYAVKMPGVRVSGTIEVFDISGALVVLTEAEAKRMKSKAIEAVKHIY